MIVLMSLYLAGFQPVTPVKGLVLDAAKTVTRTKFAGFTYGDDLSHRQVNCVQFVACVIEELMGRKLSEAELKTVYIDFKFDNIAEAVEKGDVRTAGVQNALVNKMKCAIVVSVAEVQPGDFLQYWIKRNDGSWMGHSCIVSRILPNANGEKRVAIYGSHKSTNGIADQDFNNEGLNLSDPSRKIYIARIKLNKK